MRAGLRVLGVSRGEGGGRVTATAGAEPTNHSSISGMRVPRPTRAPAGPARLRHDHWARPRARGRALHDCWGFEPLQPSPAPLTAPARPPAPRSNASTGGMCSKCFREHEKETAALKQEAADAAVPPTAPAALEAAVEACAEAMAEAEAAPAPPPASAAAPTPPPALEAVPAALAAAAPERPPQANRSRCFACRKKVGLLGFDCRCGYAFCAGHRHAADHACDFDHAARERELLAKANPLIAASKLDKM